MPRTFFVKWSQPKKPATGWRRWAYAVLFVAVVGVISYWAMRVNQPSYNDRSVVDQMARLKPQSPGYRKAGQAIRTHPDVSIPILLEWLQAPDDSRFEQWSRDFLEKYTDFKLPATTSGELHELALSGFSSLGEAALPALPQLIEILSDVQTSAPIYCAPESFRIL